MSAELSDASIGDEFLSALSGADIRARCLNFSNNQISDAGVLALCAAIRPGAPHVQSIRRLSLAYNCITCAGAHALAQVLHEGANLLELDLEGNNIAAEGANVLAHALPGSTVEIMRMSYNSLGSPLLSSWTPAMRSKQLKVLELAQLASSSVQVRLCVHCADAPGLTLHLTARCRVARGDELQS